MCGVDCMHMSKKYKTKVESYFNDELPLPKDSKVTPLKSLYAKLNFIYTCIDVLYINFKGRCVVYQDKTKEIFQKIS